MKADIPFKERAVLRMQEQTYLSMEHYLRRYEARKSAAALPPHERMLERLFAPYTDPCNPEELLAAHEADCVRMPMRRGERCLNLSNAVAVGVYEALRQWDFADLETHGQLTRYEWSEDVK